MTRWLYNRRRAVNGVCCGLLASQLMYTILLASIFETQTHPGLIAFGVGTMLLNGYFAFRPARGAEDDSGEGCQSECSDRPAGRE